MSTPMFTYVGAPFSGFDLQALVSNLVKKTSQTTLIKPFVESEVASVLEAWNAGSVAPTDVCPYPKTAVHAVEFIRDVLNVSLNDVFEATGVIERTFHGWKAKGHKPRADSLGNLWPMADTLWYLGNGHPNLEAWFHSSEQAKAAFKAGDSNRLALIEFDWAILAYPPQPSLSTNFDADTDNSPYIAAGPFEVLDSEAIPESPMADLPMVHDDGR